MVGRDAGGVCGISGCEVGGAVLVGRETGGTVGLGVEVKGGVIEGWMVGSDVPSEVDSMAAKIIIIIKLCFLYLWPFSIQ